MDWYLVPWLRRGINGLVLGAMVEKSLHLVPLDMTFLVKFCG